MEKNTNAFLTKWLISGAQIEPYDIKQGGVDQIADEQKMRRDGVILQKEKPCCAVKIGAEGIQGYPWHYYYKQNSDFVELNGSYPTPKKVLLYGTTKLLAPVKMQVELSIWSYASVTLWINDRWIAQTPAIYKPITQTKVMVTLEAGENELFVMMQNLGVRDTRNMFGIQVLSHWHELEIALHDMPQSAEYMQMEAVLENIVLKGETICLPKMAYNAYLITANTREPILTRLYSVPEGIANFEIELQYEQKMLRRSFEIYQRFSPSYSMQTTAELAEQEVLECLANRLYQQRSGNVRFSAYHVLARYLLNRVTPQDTTLLLDDLDWIDKRVDCADFSIAGIIRLLKTQMLPDAVIEKARKVFLRFRYWMDETGQDGMCFWSENHTLLFCSAQMILGEMYPEETFVCSGRLGKEQFVLGAKRCREWLAFVEKRGLEEFCSATYASVTIAALVNLVDFAPSDIAKRATVVLDALFAQLAKHTFDGVVIAPQGRVYRNLIYPYRQPLQEFTHYIDHTTPFTAKQGRSEAMWLAAFAQTNYQKPDGLKALISAELDEKYQAGDAQIQIYKRADYALTSVASPWQGYVKEAIIGEVPYSVASISKMNERYHGHTLFQPGYFGYQQHMWYAALSNQCVVFVNHPGVTTDTTAMRPGYWYGNGICPAVRQVQHRLGCIYNIPSDHPIHFTHLFFPVQAFDEVIEKASWLFARKGDGFIGVWSSRPKEKHNDLLWDCEYRVYASQVAYLIVCGSGKDWNDFASFIDYHLNEQVEYDDGKNMLFVESRPFLNYKVHQDETQYI